MFIPLVDSLRCIAGHEDTWLVASIERNEDRDIRHGFLGCPICFAEYPIREGVVYFGVDPSAAITTTMPAHIQEDDAVRLAAALDLTDPRMVAVLFGRRPSCSSSIHRRASRAAMEFRSSERRPSRRSRVGRSTASRSMRGDRAT
jgi:hypothetical protein